MKCTFCSDIELFNYYGSTMLGMCEKCQTLFNLEKDTITGWDFKFSYKERIFHLRWSNKTNLTTILSADPAKEPDIYFRVHYKQLLQVEGNSLTPLNVQQRLPTLLMFL
jgi:hypothetical protein